MMKQNSILLALIFSLSIVVGQTQTEIEKAKIPLNDYITGTSYNYPEQIQRAFIDSATLYLNRGDGTSLILSPAEYAALFEKRSVGTFTGRTSKILSIDLYQNIGQAEIEVIIPSIEARFIDLILLKKIDGAWKMISKTATRYPLDPPYSGPKQEVVMDGLKKPWSMDFLSAEEAIVAEKNGDLLRVNLQTKSKQVIKGFPDDLFSSFTLDNSKYPKGTYPSSEDGKTFRANAGILEVLLDPNFSENQHIYVSYVAEKGDTYALKVIRAKLQDNRLAEIEEILNPGPYVPGLCHFGGGMVFGADGKLYITAGERLFYEYLKEGLPIAQDITDERGKIYRINPDGSIPEDNPDFGPEAVPGMYAMGIRAAQGLCVHPTSGQIWFSEHGTIQGDEELFLDHHVRLRKAEMGPDGKLYLLTSEENGKIIEVLKGE